MRTLNQILQTEKPEAAAMAKAEKMMLSADIAQRASNYDMSEFLQGMRDARNGVTHKSKNPSYDAGYSTQYEMEQIMSEVFCDRK